MSQEQNALLESMDDKLATILETLVVLRQETAAISATLTATDPEIKPL